VRHVGHTGSGDGRTRLVERTGRKAREVLAFEGRPGYAYFDLDESFVGGGTIRVTVEFFDRDARWISLHYDSSDENLPMAGAYKSTPSCRVGTTGKWRTHAFVLPDARFRGRQNFNADFRLHAGGSVTIASVRVEP